MLKKLEELRIKIFADGADKNSMFELASQPFISGLTTNPTLMKKAGVGDYEAFAKEVLGTIKDKPISFEVFSDEFPEMERQARKINGWAENIYVKIPITNTKGESSVELIKKLSSDGIKLNITAILTLEQVKEVAEAFPKNTPSFISIFAGRIADTGRDPIPLMKEVKKITEQHENMELLWASTRELLNIFQAEEIGCEIITVTPDILAKLGKIGYDLKTYSQDTVKMFHKDAEEAGYSL